PLPGDGMARLAVGGRTLTPVEISADILRHMKRLAEEGLGREVAQAVITVPAYFDDAARAATKDAAKLAGLAGLRLINQPTSPGGSPLGVWFGARGHLCVLRSGGGHVRCFPPEPGEGGLPGPAPRRRHRSGRG